MLLTNFGTLHTVNQIVFIITLSALLMLFIYKLFIGRKIDYISVILFIITLVCLCINTSAKIYLYFVECILLIYLILDNICFIMKSLYNDVRIKKVNEHIKNDKSDYYLCLNEKGKIVDYSNSFSENCNLSKKQIIGKDGFDLIFKSFDIRLINGNEFIVSNTVQFINHLDEINSKFKLYEFTIDIADKGESKLIHYTGIIQPIFLKKKRIGLGIYLYKDKMNIIHNYKNMLDETIRELRNYKEVLNIMMSLSEGVALYFDYQERLYYVTEAFCAYCKIDTKSFDFETFYNLIVPEDQEHYMHQAQTINSLNVTRIKFRVNIHGVIYHAIEDSLFLTNENQEFVSVVHITSPVDENLNDDVLSTEESTYLINDLVDIQTASIIEQTENLIKETVKKVDKIDE